MDGTMVDNMMVHHHAWQRKLAELGLVMNLEEVRQSIHGINEEILERLFGERFTLEERKRISWEKEAAYREIFLPELKLLDGLSEFLQSAFEKGVVLGIGTAAPLENVDFVLDNLNIRHYFKTVVHAGLVSKGKPDPEVWEKVAEGMGIDLEHCVVFEDSPTGTEAAKRAGCPTFVVTTTHTREEFEEFPNVVEFLEDFTTIDVVEVLEGFYFYKQKY